MPAEATAVNFGIVFPSFPVTTYEISLWTESGRSSKVTVTYTGKGSKGPGVVIAPAGNAGPPAQAKSPLHISSAKFSPGVGAPGSPNYVRPKLTLIVRSAAATSISKVEAEV